MQDVSNADQLQINGLSDSELAVRKAWRVGDQVEIFSNTADQWYVGKVRRIYIDHEGEWLDCKYERRMSKDVKRYGTEVRPVQRKDPPQQPLYSQTNSSNMDEATIRRLMTEYEKKNNSSEKPNEESKSESDPECMLALIKPDIFCGGHVMIEKHALKNGFRVLDLKQVQLTTPRAEAFYSKHKGEALFDEEAKAFYHMNNWRHMPADFSDELKHDMRKNYYQKLIEFMTSGPIYALKLEKVNAIRDWRAIMGHADPLKSQEESLRCIRSRAKSVVENLVHGSDSTETAARELDFFFDCEQTLAIIEPDAVAAGEEDDFVAQIKSDGYTVLERVQTTLSKERAEEFYAQHKGQDTTDELIASMTSGDLVALKLEKKDAIRTWHNSRWRTRNGLHGSDSIRSAVRELTFFFPQQETLALIKPDAIRANAAVSIKKRIVAEGFTVLEACRVRLSNEQVTMLYEEHKERSYFPELTKHVTSFTCTALKLRATNGVAKLRALMGPADVEEARKHAPNSIRGKYAVSLIKNAVHCADSEESAKRELAMFFPCVLNKVRSAKQYTLALIKPDAVVSGSAQEIVNRVVYEGFVIRDQLQLKLSKESVVELYAEHKERDFFAQLVTFMVSGEVLALLLEHEDAVQKWRDVIGPVDIAMAKKESPQSVRGLFGTNAIRNAVHGSMSEQSAKRELGLFFKQTMETL